MPVTPPRPKDLPLTALRAFEAAARLGSFALAAAELGVTAGAITAHVKALEATLGAALFQRTPRGVRLTPLGQTVLPAFTDAFDALGQAVQSLRSAAAPRTVHIATLPAIAQLWLSPRLPALRAAAPDIQISITALESPPNLKRTPYDLSLFYGPEPDGAISHDIIFPVCAPAIAARLSGPADLARIPCLSDAVWSDDWALWLAAAGANITARGPVFSLYALAVEETVNGAGALIGHGDLISGHLARGTLVAPFPERLALPRYLRLWSERPLAAGSAARRTADWLRTLGMASATP
ncbi:LysR family transcriptional regulator [Paragemmobacter straminiformis]|uniref:LysR family transcriptional regulator n=1 Tax=Paragemmobacter straminiformis TaxID=2045119 RepID=A0A842I5P6_9RHOB|nr:LysR family transcriptional regulator [Gemmobacter straminiformis]MBC2834743.1 LysR family transcriptional regulator [Gemmobacter straminiformis]